MRKVFVVTTFFAGTYGFVFLIILFVLSLGYSVGSSLFPDRQRTSAVYAAIPSSDYVIDASIEEKDGRVDSVRNFLQLYKSPLSEYAEIIVNAADRNKVDYKLIPAIAMQESGGCRVIPDNSFNCWGFGIYGKKVTRFEDYPEAIETVTKAMGKHYIQKGLDTPDSIMPVYTPPSKGSWSRGITYFMEQMQ